jgi:hypothetical protein
MPAYAMGNGVAGVSLFGSGVQAKLTVGQPNDPYEQEADNVAQRITSGQPVASISAVSPGGLKNTVHRQMEEPEDQSEDETLTQALLIQRELAEEDEEETEDPPTEIAQPLLQRESREEEEESDGVTQASPIQQQPEEESEDEELPEEAVQPLLIQRQAAEEDEGLGAEEENPEAELAQPFFLQRDALDGKDGLDEEHGEIQPKSGCGCKGPCECADKASAEATPDTSSQPAEVAQKSRSVVQTNSGNSSKGGDNDGAAVTRAIRQRGAGESFNPGVQKSIEAQTGFDMSSVRVHRDDTAQSANRSLKARAFTHGKDIWLGPGESPNDLSLMAHEATHVVQQNAGGDSLQTIQRKPSDYQHAEDGGNVRGRLNERFDEIDESEREEHADEPVNRAELRSQSGELRGETRPDVDRPAQERPGVEQTAAAVERETETPPEPIVDSEATTAPEGETQPGEEATGAAEQAAALAQQAFAAAGAQPEPPTEIEVQPPEPVIPVDSAGEPLEADPEAESALASLGDRAQYMREQGTLMRAQAAEGRSNAEIMRGNLARVTSEITKAEEGITRSQDHASYRREVVGQAEQALGVSEEKAATVAAGSPEFTAKADEGREDSGPMAGEANSLVAENAANTPEDEDAAADSREQGQQMGQVGSDSATMDGAISQTRARATSLGEDAARAAEMNTQTTGTIGASTQQLDQLDARLGQHSEQAGQARAQVESMASQPADLHERANQLEQMGQALIASSFELEARLHEVQGRYAAGTASVPGVEPWEGEVPEESGAEGALQLQPNDEEIPPTLPAGGAAEVTPVATTSTPAEVPSTTTAPTTTSTTPSTSGSATTTGSSVAPQVTTTTGLQPGASATQEAEATEPPVNDEEPAATGEAAPTPASSDGATAPAAPEVSDAGGATEEEMPDLIDLEPQEREPIDVNQQLPPWLTGIDPQSVEDREAAAQQQQDQRRTEIASINEMAGGRPISQLGAGERLGIAMRVVGGRYYNMVSGIKWPGWGGLARALLDPRSMLTGAVGGLNMILNAGSNLFSAERWRQDPLGNLLKSSADIATGLAIILGSITALAAVVAAVMGALILVTFGFAAPIAIPVISVCTTIITTVGGWTIVVGKIALVLQALSLIKNLIDAATAQTAQDLQREAGEIQSDINGGFAAAMSIVGAKGAQAGIGRLNNRVANTMRGMRRAGGAGNFARQTLGRGVSTARRGTQVVGRGIVRGARVVGRGARTVGGGIVTGVRSVGRGVGRIGRGVRTGARKLRDRLRRRFGRTDSAALIGRSRSLRIGGASHTLSIRRVGGRLALWLCTDCGEFLDRVSDITRSLPRTGPVARRMRSLQRQAAKLNRRLPRMNPADADAQLRRLSDRLEQLAANNPGERAFAAARLTWGANFMVKVRKHAEQMRRIARGHGVAIPLSPSDPATVGIMRAYIQQVVRTGQTKFGRYMTFPDAIWTKLDDAIIIRRANGEFVTFLDYAQGGAARGWDILP